MSLLGSFGKALVGGVTGFVTGGPAGALVGAGMSFAGGGGRPQTMPAPPQQVTQPTTSGGMPINIFGGIGLGPGGITGTAGITRTTQVTGSVQAQGGGCPRGYHLNKHALPASRGHGAVGPRSICVRNRHLNALNGRAATRALRRLKRANKMTRKIHALFHRAPARKAAFGRKK